MVFSSGFILLTEIFFIKVCRGQLDYEIGVVNASRLKTSFAFGTYPVSVTLESSHQAEKILHHEAFHRVGTI